MDELRAALRLATDEELNDLTTLLFCRRLNPLDYVRIPDPVEIQGLSRCEQLDALEGRFRFLAADGVTILRGKTRQLTYRQILLQVCRHLKVPYKKDLPTVDLESEIFLTLLERVWQRLPNSNQAALTKAVQQSLISCPQGTALPKHLLDDPVRLVFSGSSALVMNSVVKHWVLQHVARQVATQLARYQLAKQAVIQAGTATLEGYATLHLAKRGIATSSARYAATRTFFGVLGPALWALFFADLSWRAIAVNYSRVIPMVFTLAQIRLTRAEQIEAA